MDKKNTFTFTDNRDGKSYDFDIINGTRGPSVIDSSSFYSKTNMFLYDPGFTSTANCKSDITFIDGKKGELIHRGYHISDLVQNHSYLDVVYLLLNSKLPTANESKSFDTEIRYRSYLPEGLRYLFQAFPAGAHPMSTLSSAVAALASFYYKHLNVETEDEFQEMARRIVSKIPTIAAFAHRHSVGIPYVHPDIGRYFTENFLYMLRAYPNGKLRAPIKDIEVRALDTIFSLHADHEQNASTTTVKTVGSTGAHPYVSISAGISALWGRAHGGANESVIAQLSSIGSVDKVDEFIKKVKDPNDSVRLMGFGHRVYKSFDPRATELKKLRDQLKTELDLDTNIMQIADKVEEIALNDEYFVSRNLYPNIDFYSGTILTALDIPSTMFTPIFVIGRTVGWITQWMEQKRDPKTKITRPRQLYIGK
ncbi:MAG: Citrate synthase (si) (EC [uncultured Campylobacterales bacterium]|uniref:Citrate synthase n=1 Tax=uncultured Campylobacterales bacterium TaxID=352960 RepID=A0A6S6SKR5_9BACT|nr:MAG: Citrate synthase (si) (EC [uncultured Campylobacterales bacterium]